MEPNQTKRDQSLMIKIKRIIPKAYSRKLQLTKYLIGVSEPKNASQIISALKQLQTQKDKKEQIKHLKQNEEYPFKQSDQKHFLKRVRKNGNNKIEVILCRANSQNKGNVINYLRNFHLLQKVQQVQLPSQAPLTKDQYQQWSKLWPINFILHEIAKQIPHTQISINFLTQLIEKPQQDYNIYLIDTKCEKILLKQKGKCQQGTISHPVMNLLQKWPLCQEFTSKLDKYYYLTGLKIYAKKQLCGMCSMALIHSRVHSIYLNFEPTSTMDKIMGCPKLNHQIIMFSIT